MKKFILVLIALGLASAAIKAVTDADRVGQPFWSEKERAAYERIGRQYYPNSSDPAEAGLTECLHIHGYNSVAEAQESGVLPAYPPASRRYDPGCPIYGSGK